MADRPARQERKGRRRSARWPVPEVPAPEGLRAGDGVFETLRTYRGEPFLLGRHLARLREGARAIRLTGIPSEAALRLDCLESLARARSAGRAAEWILRPMIYSTDGAASVSVAVAPLPIGARRPRANGLVVGVSSYPHPGRFLAPPGASAPVKWLGRGPLSHALRDARSRGWEEAILLDGEGRLVEGSRSNLLVVVDGILVSPGPESWALPGITRGVVLEEAHALGLQVEERAPTREEVKRATEAMLTSSLLEVAPVRRLVGVARWGSSKAGSVGPQLRRAYAARTGAA